MIRQLLLLLVFFLISVISTFAQDIEVVEQCIIDFREPPDNWTFEGTIITYGHDGLYGFRADTSSRYFIAFNNNREFARFGSLSSDGKWFATFRGSVTPNMWCCNATYSVDEIRVVSTSPDRVIYTIPFDYYEYTINPSFPPIEWEADTMNFLAYIKPGTLGFKSGWTYVDPIEGNITPLSDDENILINTDSIIIADQIESRYLLPDRLMENDLPRAFLLKGETPIRGLLYLTSVESNILYNTCIETQYAIAISPSGNQVAFSGQEGGFVYVVDLDEWIAYRLNLAANHIMAWVADT